MLICCIAATLASTEAASPPSATFTQVDAAGEAIGESHQATCDMDGCRAVLPVAFPAGICIVAVDVSSHDRSSTASLRYSLRGCTPPRAKEDSFLDNQYPSRVKLDRYHAATQIITLRLGTALSTKTPNGEQPSLLRLDLIFPPPAQR